MREAKSPAAMAFNPRKHLLLRCLDTVHHREHPYTRFIDRFQDPYHCHPNLLHRSAVHGKLEKTYHFTSCKYRGTGTGTRNRHTVDGSGYWKSTDGVKPVMDEVGGIAGYEQKFKFCTNHAGDGPSRSWLMTEYTLSRTSNRMAICVVHNTGNTAPDTNVTEDPQPGVDAGNTTPVTNGTVDDDYLCPSFIDRMLVSYLLDSVKDQDLYDRIKEHELFWRNDYNRKHYCARFFGQDNDSYRCHPGQLHRSPVHGALKKSYHITMCEYRGETMIRNRHTRDSSGYWKATNEVKTVTDEFGMIVGYKQEFKFHTNHAENGPSRSWLMTEYTLHLTSKNRMAICVIHNTGNTAPDTNVTVDLSDSDLDAVLRDCYQNGN